VGRRRGPIELATRRSIDPVLRQGGLAVMALDLARTLDEQELSASAQSAVARELRMQLAELDRLDSRVIPEQAGQPTSEGDAIDQLRARRESRRGPG